MLPPTAIKILTLISGVLALVLPNLNVLGLPDDVRAVISSVGGLLILVLAFLEHPTIQNIAASKNNTPGG